MDDDRANWILNDHSSEIKPKAKRLAYIKGLEFDDLVQEGNMAILKIIDRYDGMPPNEFRALARVTAHGAMNRYADKTTVAHLAYTDREEADRVRKSRRNLEIGKQVPEDVLDEMLVTYLYNLTKETDKTEFYKKLFELRHIIAAMSDPVELEDHLVRARPEDTPGYRVGEPEPLTFEEQMDEIEDGEFSKVAQNRMFKIWKKHNDPDEEYY